MLHGLSPRLNPEADYRCLCWYLRDRFRYYRALDLSAGSNPLKVIHLNRPRIGAATRTFLTLIVGVVSAGIAMADSLPIQPGKWETKITSTITPYLPQPQVQTHVECISEPRFDPAVMMHKYGSFKCAANRTTRSGNTLTWRMDCHNPALPELNYAGVGTFTADSKTKGHGTMNINMSVPALGPGVMHVQSVATRVGACG